MGRILAFDYGTKRVGIAATDPLRIIANGLTTVHSKDIFVFVNNYIKTEKVDLFVVGEPKRLNNTQTQNTKYVTIFVNQLKKQFPSIPVVMVDERFTSKMAFQTMIVAGLKKKDRKDKELVDQISATIILQSYLEQINNK
jgi:putative Holliday junction resolvase